MSEFSITVLDMASGRTEILPLDPNTSIQDVVGFCQAIFGIEGKIRLLKEGKALSTSATLQSAGVVNGDMLAAQKPAAASRPAPAPAAPAAAAVNSSGGLDFSNLFAAAPPAASPAAPPPPVYYPGMSVDDAMMHNRHPHTFVSLLLSKDHLFKEFRYHNEPLALKLKEQPLEKAVETWRESLVKGSIETALKRTTDYHKNEEMTRRLAQNVNDSEAKEYFATIERKKKVEEQYIQMMNEYPESMGRVLMLYIDCKINGHTMQAFCDSGAQMTIMSEKAAKECGIFDLIDTRFSGMAAGVGTGKILGKVHIVQLEIGGSFFPCSISIMETPKDKNAQEMPFLFGLDMMKRHLCQIDLQQGCLNFPVSGVKVPFLHEKDLNESQGGTKGFDANKANLEIQELLMKQYEGKGDKDDGNNNKMDESS